MFEGMEERDAAESGIRLTLFTDAFVIRGLMRSRHERVTDILNEAEHAFVVLTDVLMDEYGSRSLAVRSEYAQVNLTSVLFALADKPSDAVPERSVRQSGETAMVSIPPFRIVGRVDLLPERNIRDALGEMTGRFVPVLDAAYWSETVGEARTTAPLVAFNHARAQILAPHRELDPWEGLDRSSAQGPVNREPDALGEVPQGVPSTSGPSGQQDPWAAGTAAGGTTPRGDPWRDLRVGVDASGESGPPDSGEAPPPGNPWGGPGGDPWGAGRPRRDDELIG